MHILFLTDNFPPEGNAPATRTFEHAREWVNKGVKVTVITCAPNFPEGIVFDGYKNSWYQKEQMSGIEVVRVKTYITANEGFAKRILDYMSFMVMSFIAGLFQSRPDVVIATSPQFFAAVSGWLLSAVRRKPFIFELRDIWPASITAVGAMKDSKVIKMLESLELFLYRRADRIVSVTNSFKTELIERGIDQNKIDVILNGVDLSQYQIAKTKDAELSDKYNLNGKFVAGYVGTHGMAHGLEYIVQAAELLQSNIDVCILFAGGGAAREQLEKDVQSKRLHNVVLIERQPKEMMPRLWSLCDLSIVSLRDTPLFKTVIPSKIFETMGMGIPIIINVPEGEATEIIEESGAGVVVQPESPKELANIISHLKENPFEMEVMKKNASSSAPKFSRKLMADKMLTIINDVIKMEA